MTSENPRTRRARTGTVAFGLKRQRKARKRCQGAGAKKIKSQGHDGVKAKSDHLNVDMQPDHGPDSNSDASLSPSSSSSVSSSSSDSDSSAPEAEQPFQSESWMIKCLIHFTSQGISRLSFLVSPVTILPVFVLHSLVLRE